MRKHDVAFLVTVKPVNIIGTHFYKDQPFREQVGLTYVRGCEIEGMLDQNGRVIEEGKNSICSMFFRKFSKTIIWQGNHGIFGRVIMDYSRPF